MKLAKPLLAGLVSASLFMGDQISAKPPTENIQQIINANSGKIIIKEAERYLGVEYKLGGRMTKRNPGLDCQGIIILPYSKIFNFNRREVPVWDNQEVVESGLLGHPVSGLDGVLRDEIDFSLLDTGDVLYFLNADFKNNDTPLLVRDGDKYLTWHVGLYKGGEDHSVLHASPLQGVTIETIDNIHFDALYVTRRR